jgi:hypothetical protein
MDWTETGAPPPICTLPKKSFLVNLFSSLFIVFSARAVRVISYG